MTGRGARYRRGRRTHRVPVRFTYQELAIARQRAHAAGRPLARYLRESALKRAPQPVRLRAHDDVVASLSRIVRVLDDHDGSSADGAVAEALAALRMLLTELTA